ncbi:MAG: glycosyltransferase [Burkholderiaceae bacterium]
MRILLIAPQPFYTERGTPIAVRLAATVLVRAGHEVDLLCYPEGEDVALEGLTVHRIRPPSFVRNVPIGFSWKKLVCDLWLAAAAWKRIRNGHYDVVHAVEEAVFLALAARRWRRFALVYDMDSLMSAQLVEKKRAFKVIEPLLRTIERSAVRHSDRVLAVCPALETFAREAGGGSRVHLLPDVPFPLPDGVLLNPTVAPTAEDENLRAAFQHSGALVLYVGNLEHYQGVDLLLDALAQTDAKGACNLVVVGGTPVDVTRYRARVGALHLEEQVRIIGARPLAQLPDLLAQADILCSPRLVGTNTPMKIYSYLAAGRAVLATAIESHTQVLDRRCALLVAPSAKPLGAALLRLAGDPALRAGLAANARRRAHEHYGFDRYEQRLTAAYRGLGSLAELTPVRGVRPPPPPAFRVADTSGESPAAPAARSDT